MDENDRRRVPTPNCSAQQTGDEAAKRGTPELSSWTMVQNCAKVLLLIATHKLDRVVWLTKHAVDYFHDAILTDEGKFQFCRVTRKRWAIFGMSEKIVPKFSPSFTVLGGIVGMTWTALFLISGNID